MGITITIGNSKGGVGKSTIACNLAVAAAQDSKKILLVDADSQSSSLSFRSIRPIDDIKATAITTPTLHKDLSDFDFDLIIIDSGGRDSTVFRSAILAADILIIPVLPSVFDLWAAEDTVKIFNEAAVYNDGLKAYFVLNMVMPQTVMTRELIDSLDKQDIPVLNNQLCARVDFKNALMQGLGVVEYAPRSKAATELNSLYKEIINKGQNK